LDSSAASQTILLAWLLKFGPYSCGRGPGEVEAASTATAGHPEFAGVLSRIRESLDYPAAVAQALCQTLGDAKSYAGFKARCDAAYMSELEPQWLVSAYEQAMGPKVRNQGALFQTVCRWRE
jgi:hypothetical protein